METVELAELNPLEVHLSTIPLSLSLKGPNMYVDIEPLLSLSSRFTASGAPENDSKTS